MGVLEKGGPDIFVMEGTVIQGPGGSGRYDMFLGRPMMEWVRDYAASAAFVVAIGDCASWAACPSTAPIELNDLPMVLLSPRLDDEHVFLDPFRRDRTSERRLGRVTDRIGALRQLLRTTSNASAS